MKSSSGCRTWASRARKKALSGARNKATSRLELHGVRLKITGHVPGPVRKQSNPRAVGVIPLPGLRCAHRERRRLRQTPIEKLRHRAWRRQAAPQHRSWRRKTQVSMKRESKGWLAHSCHSRAWRGCARYCSVANREVQSTAPTRRSGCSSIATQRPVCVDDCLFRNLYPVSDQSFTSSLRLSST